MTPNFKEILKKRGITQKAQYHTYEYMYNSMLESMKEVWNAAIEEAYKHSEIDDNYGEPIVDKDSILKLKIK